MEIEIQDISVRSRHRAYKQISVRDGEHVHFVQLKLETEGDLPHASQVFDLALAGALSTLQPVSAEVLTNLPAFQALLYVRRLIANCRLAIEKQEIVAGSTPVALLSALQLDSLEKVVDIGLGDAVPVRSAEASASEKVEETS